MTAALSEKTLFQYDGGNPAPQTSQSKIPVVLHRQRRCFILPLHPQRPMHAGSVSVKTDERGIRFFASMRQAEIGECLLAGFRKKTDLADAPKPHIAFPQYFRRCGIMHHCLHPVQPRYLLQFFPSGSLPVMKIGKTLKGELSDLLADVFYAVLFHRRFFLSAADSSLIKSGIMFFRR